VAGIAHHGATSQAGVGERPGMVRVAEHCVDSYAGQVEEVQPVAALDIFAEPGLGGLDFDDLIAHLLASGQNRGGTSVQRRIGLEGLPESILSWKCGELFDFARRESQLRTKCSFAGYPSMVDKFSGEKLIA
jgi:copper chaperone CopZ